MSTLSPGIYLELIPDWNPSKWPWVARFDAIVKVRRGVVLEDASAVTVRLLDKHDTLVAQHIGTMHADHTRMQGPAWQHLSGRLLEVDSTVTQAEASLLGILSHRVHRGDAKEPVLLAPVPFQVGVPREPHLWWRYYNRTEEPVLILSIIRDQTLWLDGRSYQPEFGHYDGPQFLQPGRHFSGFWSLDDFEPSARRGRHRVQLEIFGLRSGTLDVEWRGDSSEPTDNHPIE